MSYENRLNRLERSREEEMERAHDDFRLFLRRMDHRKRGAFFEFVMDHLDQAPAELLPLWPHSESPFSLPSSDERVVQWLAELSVMKFERDDAADQFLHRLSFQFRRANSST